MNDALLNTENKHNRGNALYEHQVNPNPYMGHGHGGGSLHFGGGTGRGEGGNMGYGHGNGVMGHFLKGDGASPDE